MSEEYDAMKVVSVEDVDIDTLSTAELLDRYCYRQMVAAMTQEASDELQAKKLREAILNKMDSK